MGTHTSKHNHGRKPLYKEKRRYLIDKVHGLAKTYCNPSGSLEQEDFEQEIWLALCEGRMELWELEKPSIIKELREDCPQIKLKTRQWHVEAFNDDYWQTASNISAKEWRREQLMQRVGYDGLPTYSVATQIEDVWEQQIHRLCQTSYDGLSFDEVASVTSL
jgi:hypothetical protein